MHAGSQRAHLDFNPRAHEGHDGKGIKVLLPTNFNPRAHEGHDEIRDQLRELARISIHVPTRGTTRLSEHTLTQAGFQSTCPRGARLRRSRVTADVVDFNPRAHEGHDGIGYIFTKTASISIHVPTRGTTVAGGILGANKDFNPRAHEGHDGHRNVDTGNRRFQSTCPRGARRSGLGGYGRCAISIHVPTRGTTLWMRRYLHL